ncbi:MULTISPECIES: LysR family transcriptional regulator [unclassified Phyllobacterium]|uniref:LysR family transcriptional regulator n=1 Tax=Phyllobacterium TaxID=28100 RepID=UPI000DDD8DFF|nr:MULTISPECIES: LysR family transcriptional regulator [unclassified Phyllobacterium]MBA8901696.1 DNA-binding transcriptional LysR family regulator [Phyllobacterium sp. P30BS-XVII]UGX88954.1 LysR family transcriptional regulator [Phyllobacterium sp. T1293]
MDINRLDLNLLVTLDTLLAERNVTRAAERLNLSQPALSARLARLRDILGDQLLLPVQRGMVPTQRALELQTPLHEALESVRRVVAEGASFEPSTAVATISIVASDYVQYSILMLLAAALRTEAPGVRIAWRSIEASQLIPPMERGEVDLALITPDIAPEQLRMRKLYRERYVAIVRTDHPIVRGSIDLDIFCALDHVIVSPQGGGFTGPTDEALEAVGRNRRVVLSTPGFLMVPELIERSDMIALVPYRIARDRSQRLQILEPPLIVPGFSIAMVWHDRTTTHPVQRWLREKIAAIATGDPGPA